MRSCRSTLIAVLLLVSPLLAHEPIGWRTNGTGVYPDAKPPTQWSKTENVAWATKMPSRSNSQPVITGDKLFVCAEPFKLLCLNLSDGKILWERDNAYRDFTSEGEWSEIEKQLNVAQGLLSRLDEIEQAAEKLNARLKTTADKRPIETELEDLHTETNKINDTLRTLPLAARYTVPKTQPQYNGFTTATPTTDGKHVWAVFGNRAVVCFDLDGNRKWATVLPDNPQSMWGHSSSPVLVGDRLIVTIEDIVALDAATGKEIWRSRYGQTWGSPITTRVGGEDVVLLSNGRVVRVADGQIMARVPPLDRSSPVLHGDKAYYVGIYASKFQLPEKLADKIEMKELWSVKTKGGEVYSSPVVHKGLIYTVSTSHILNVIDAETGESVYVTRLSLGRDPVWPSLSAAGDYIYISSRDGNTLVLQAGREYKEVATNRLEFFISTPVFHNNRMYVRTNDHVFCIGE